MNIKNVLQLSKTEAVENVIRKHWFILLKQVIALVTVYILPMLLFLFFSGRSIELGPHTTLHVQPDASLIFFGLFAWSLVIWMKLFGVLTDYFLDMWIITSRRMIDVEQKGFFHREVSSFRIDRIQDVTIEIQGVIPTFLDYGDLHVQTAGESKEFIIRGIGKPKHIKEVVLSAIDANIER